MFKCLIFAALSVVSISADTAWFPGSNHAGGFSTSLTGQEEGLALISNKTATRPENVNADAQDISHHRTKGSEISTGNDDEDGIAILGVLDGCKSYMEKVSRDQNYIDCGVSLGIYPPATACPEPCTRLYSNILPDDTCIEAIRKKASEVPSKQDSKKSPAMLCLQELFGPASSPLIPVPAPAPVTLTSSGSVLATSLSVAATTISILALGVAHA